MLLSFAAVGFIAWRHRPRWLARWALVEPIVIFYLGDLLWQVAQAIIILPIPDVEATGWGLSCTDFSAVVSFGSQGSGWNHATMAAIGIALVIAYSIGLTAGLTRACRRRRAVADA